MGQNFPREMEKWVDKLWWSSAGETRPRLIGCTPITEKWFFFFTRIIQYDTLWAYRGQRKTIRTQHVKYGAFACAEGMIHPLVSWKNTLDGEST